MRTLSVAAIQTAPVPHDLDATWSRFADEVRAVKDLFRHVQLAMVPELMLSAEAPLLEARSGWMKAAAVELPGPLTRKLGSLAEETGLWLVPGSVYERDGDQIFNTVPVISPDGDLVARYRKVFPWQPYEQCTPGSSFTVFDLPGIGKAGLAICYDGSFPETVRQLAWHGAEVILQPTLTTTRDREMEAVCARANAWTNQVHVVNLNAADPCGVGESLIVDPEGVVRQRAGAGREVLVDVLDLDQVTKVRRYGSSGLNRPWTQLANSTARLPMYGGATMIPPPWI